jgi:hypothetical protein
MSGASVPPAKRRCGFCARPLTAIELWCDCPERRLAVGLHRLRFMEAR